MDKLSLLAHPDFNEIAGAIADKLDIPVVETSTDILARHYLRYDGDGLSLVSRQYAGGNVTVVTRCDFVSGRARHRRMYGGGVGQALAKAAGVSANFKPAIVDLTAGLGRDAFVLASLGSQMILTERSKVVAALLFDGLVRLQKEALNDDVLKPVAERLTFYELEGKTWLKSLEKSIQPDVIYLDPMFPERSKTARVKKEMAIFSGLVGDDTDADELLEPALDTARYRVVVKRPRRAPPLGGIKPGFYIGGKTTRFDVYPLKKMPR